MVVSESLLKWIVRLYPPLFFQRIWVVKFDKGFRGVRVEIKKSFFNRNYNNSIFGGTIFSAADPFYPLLFHQLLSHKNYKVIVWSKSSQIQFIKPALTKLHFNIRLTDDHIAEIEHILKIDGKYVKAHSVDIYNINSELCATLVNEVYIRNLNFIESIT